MSRYAKGKRPHGMGDVWASPTRLISYYDPNQPKFTEDRSPIRCQLCGNVPRNKALIVNGHCKNEGACTKRQNGKD